MENRIKAQTSAVWVTAAILMLCTQAAWAARDMCQMLRDKGVLDDAEYNECKAAQEQEEAKSDDKVREVLGVRLPQWLERITPFGDLRLRYEGFYANGLNARNRFRLRARVGLNATISDELIATVRLASGNPDDPISTNQSFERTFTHKPVNLDQAFLTLKPGETFWLEPGWVTMVGGKFSVNAYRVSELIWDDDLTPEGATETLNLVERKDGFLRGLRVNAFQWVVDELSAKEDPWMLGGQIVADTALGTTANWSIAFANYHWENLNAVASKYLSPTRTDPEDPTQTVPNPDQNRQLANSNRVVKDALGNITGFQERFNLVNWATEVNFTDPFGIGTPAGLFGDAVYNTRADGKNVGFYLGAGIGKTGKNWYANKLKNQGDWAVSYTWAWIEQSAAVAMFSFSNLDYVNRDGTQKGSTNVTAHILRLDYMPLPNFQVTAKPLFINALDRKSSNASLDGNPTLLRLQLDAMVKF